MLELRTRKREIRGDGGKHHEKLGHREFRVRINLPCPIQQVKVPIWQVITPINGILNPIRHVVLLMSQSHWSHPYHSHLHPPSLSFSSTMLSSSQEHDAKSSLPIAPCHHHELIQSAVYTEYHIHQVPHTRSTTYIEYHIHRVQHTPSTAYTEYSIHCVQHTPKDVCRPIILTLSS